MKVYVVVRGFNHEGYDVPEGVFASKAKAEQRATAIRREGYADEVKVLEYDLDETPSPSASTSRTAL